MRKPQKSKAHVSARLHLDHPPDHHFVELLAEAGDGDVVNGPDPRGDARVYTPEEIEEAVVEGAIGTLLEQARLESRCSLADIGTEAGVTRARIQQIERSENIEIATLVRIAAACGYEVGISLRPLSAGKRAFATVL